MFSAASFFGAFIDYLRPTKSPYLVVILIAVGVICFKVGISPSNGEASAAERLDVPGFFVPIYLIIFAMVPLSLLRRKNRSPTDTDGHSSPDDTVSNAKYENDIDGVFKFSRALCLAIAALMLLVYYRSIPADNLYATLAYWAIITQLATFLCYMTFKHYSGEDISNIGLFQISFITATLFAGSTYLGSEIRHREGSFEYFYYCKTQTVEFEGTGGHGQYRCSETPPSNRGNIRVKTEIYRPDFMQISFAVIFCCWLVYEIFWLNALFRMMRSSPGAKTIGAAETSPNVSG